MVYTKFGFDQMLKGGSNIDHITDALGGVSKVHIKTNVKKQTQFSWPYSHTKTCNLIVTESIK